MARSRKKSLAQVVIEACEIIPIGCLTCGLKQGDGAVLYPYPLSQGTMYCPTCSPLWLKSFLDFATANLRKQLNAPTEEK